MTGIDENDSTEALLKSDAPFRLMIEAVMDYGIFLLDPDGCVASWNVGAQRIKGYTAADIIGQHFSVFYPAEARESKWPQYELEVAKKEGRFEDEGWRIRKDGSRFWANVVITAIRKEDGKLLGFTKVTRDLTERKLYEEELRQSQQELEQANLDLSAKNRELQDFAYAASHDLQEPLRRISTFAELLEQEYKEAVDGDGQMYIDRIRVSAKRMSMLIKELLSYSRVTTRPQPLQAVDLNRVVDDVIFDLHDVIGESGGSVQRGILPQVEADPAQMRQLIHNLLENAIKFRRPGVPPEVRVTAEPSHVPSNGDVRTFCTIVVEDNGIGFDEQFIDRIFAPFFRLHTRRAFEGTGLGLAICKRIVDRHGGSISASSDPSSGTRFAVTLPLRQRATPVDGQIAD